MHHASKSESKSNCTNPVTRRKLARLSDEGGDVTRRRELILSMADVGNWFVIYRSTFKVMSKLEVLFFHDLMNVCNRKGRAGDWFPCTVEEMSRTCDWDRNTQTRLLASLRRKGFVETRKDGLPAQRYVLLKVENVFDPDKTQSTQKRVDKTTHNGVEYTTHNGDNPVRDTNVSLPSSEKERIQSVRESHISSPGLLNEGKKDPSPSEVLAKKLHDGLKKRGRGVKLPKVHPFLKWRREFDALLEDVAIDEVQRVLDWYLEHLHDKYTPSAFCARTFREKFHHIERATRRGMVEVRFLAKVVTVWDHPTKRKGSFEEKDVYETRWVDERECDVRKGDNGKTEYEWANAPEPRRTHRHRKPRS